MTLGLGFPNRFDGGTLSGQGWTSTLPISNLSTRQISQVARGQWTVSKFYAAFSAATAARLVGLVGHNLSTAGKLRVRGYSTDPRPPVDKHSTAAALDIDFADGFPGSVTCTRSTVGLYVDSAGVLQSAAINVARTHWDINTPGRCLGLLAEGAATNLALRCRNWTVSPWTTANSMSAANTSTGVDGTASSATRLTAGASNSRISQAITAASGGTLSVYARRITGSGTVSLTGNAFGATTTITLTSAWKRFELTGLGTNPTVGVQIATSGDAIDVDFAQVEAKSGATSPILTTTGTASRGADTLTYDIPAAYQPSLTTGSWVLALRALAVPLAGTSTELMRLTNGTVSSVLQLDSTSARFSVRYINGGATDTNTAGPPASAGGDYAIAASFANADHRAYCNTGALTNSAAPATAVATATQIKLQPTTGSYAFARFTQFSTTQDNTNLGTLSATFTPLTAGYDSGLIDAWPAAWVSGTTAEQRAGARGVALADLGADQSYQYWRIDLSDSANTAGYVQLGRVFMGSAWLPAHGMATGVTLGYESRSTTTEADDGAEYHDEKRSPLVVRFNLEAQSQNEAMLKILEMQRQLGTTGELLFIWDTADSLYAPYRTFLGRLRSLTPLTAINRNLWSAAFEVKEAL